jgi:hypothetical protein
VTRQHLARWCFGVLFVISAFSFGLQLVQDYLAVWDPPGTVEPSHAVRMWRFFSYFSTQSDLLVVITSYTLLRRPDRDGPIWRVVRLNTLTGTTITALVHWFLLHPLDHFHGLLWASDTLTHIVVPTLAVAAWLVFGPRRRISPRVILWGLAYPLVWLAYTLVVGGINGFYPYFFLDVKQSGAGVVAIYSVAILVLLFVVSCLFWLGDRWLPGRLRAGPDELSPGGRPTAAPRSPTARPAR